jgi:hypothetical protein
VALRKGFGDAFMFVAVSVSHAKLPLPGILPPAHRNHRPDLIVRGERVTPFDCAEQRGERLRTPTAMIAPIKDGTFSVVPTRVTSLSFLTILRTVS